MSDYYYTFKVLIVGNSSVGKSSLLVRYADSTFSESLQSTIGVDLRIKTLQVSDQNIKLAIWDTAGQEKFKTIIASYYKGAHAVIFAFDVSDRNSLLEVSRWESEALVHCNKNPIKILVGTKSDIICRTVSREEGSNFASEHGMEYFQTSAKTGANVEKTFEKIATSLYSEQVKFKLNPEIRKKSLLLEEQPLRKPVYRCC